MECGLVAEANGIYLDQHAPEPHWHRVAGGRAAVISMRSPTKSSPNEDGAAVLPCGDECAVLVVTDGLGGHRSGDLATALAIEAMRDALDGVRDPELMRPAILDGIEQANRSIMQLGGPATTMVVLEICRDRVRPYHVGDSSIMLVGQRGRMKLHTVDHSPVGMMVEAGLLDEADAMHHEARHIVSNVVGAADMRIEIGSEIQFAPRDTVLLSSDGLTDNLHSSEIVEHIRRGPLDKAATSLVAEARRRMSGPEIGEPSKPDDMTFILFRRR